MCFNPCIAPDRDISGHGGEVSREVRDRIGCHSIFKTCPHSPCFPQRSGPRCTYERESIIVCSPFSIFDSLSFPHMQPGFCTKSIGHSALPESSHRGLHVPGESATHRGKVLGGGRAGWRPPQPLRNRGAGLRPGVMWHVSFCHSGTLFPLPTTSFSSQWLPCSGDTTAVTYSCEVA